MPRARSSRAAAASSVASVKRKSSGPLGRKRSVGARTSLDASRACRAPARISLRRFGSKETVPPRALMRPRRRGPSPTMAGDDSEVPMTCRWSALSIRRSAAAVGADRAGGAVADVVDEVARAVGAVADEGAAGRAAPGGRRWPRRRRRRARSRSTLRRPKSSSPTQPIMPQGWPSFATWSMKMAGAPDGNGPTSGIGSRKPSPTSVAMISTRISPMVMTFFTAPRGAAIDGAACALPRPRPAIVAWPPASRRPSA